MAHILIVDNNNDMHAIIEAFIGRIDPSFKFLHSHSGAESETMCETLKPDLVTMEIRMPVMDGWETTRRIKEHSPNLPVIAITTALWPSDIRRSIEVGFDAVLGKPICFQELRDVICKHLHCSSEVVA